MSGTKTETKTFINLPVKNLSMSKEFFGKLGFTFNPQFTDDTAACMVLSENAVLDGSEPQQARIRYDHSNSRTPRGFRRAIHSVQGQTLDWPHSDRPAGAILLTGYLGGAVNTHVRAGQ